MNQLDYETLEDNLSSCFFLMGKKSINLYFSSRWAKHHNNNNNMLRDIQEEQA